MKTLRALLPWLALALAFAGVAAGIHTAFVNTYERGHAAGADSVQKRWNAHQAESATREAALQAHHRAREQTLIAHFDERTANHLKELERVQREKDDFTAGVRAGRIRLSIPVAPSTTATACNAHHGAAPADPTPAPAPAETRAELAPAAAQSLVAIADDGDAAIRDLNTCIDLHHITRSAINHVQNP